MTDSPRIAAMGRTLVDRGIDLGNDRAAILCLINAGHDARDVEDGLDLAIAFARRILDAREVIGLDDQLRRIAAIMRNGHAA